MRIEADGPAPPIARERRYLTIVYSDLVGYTQLSEQMDPEDLRDLQLEYQRAALTVMEDYGGFVASYSGDGILVYFGYPSAHENDAERATRAAIELVQRVPELQVATADGGHPPLSVRVGVHTGLLVIGSELLSRGRMEYGVVGEAVNLAARLKDEAPVNTVVVTQETLELVDGLFESEALGERRLRGLSRPIGIHRIVRPRHAAGRMRRGATRMIGRGRELAELAACWQRTIGERRCTLVQILGEAGVGKTRLVHEFCHAQAFATAEVLRLNCLELFSTTPLYAVASALWLRLGLAAEDDESARTARIAAFLQQVDADTPHNRSVLAGLLGFALAPSAAATPQSVKQEQFGLLERLLLRIVGERPTLLWIDDAHWLDPSTAELLPRIVAALAGAPVLIVFTTRSFPKGPLLPAPDHVVRVEQLGNDECLELARAVPGAQVVSDRTLVRAAAACDGIPLFIEQMMLSLISQAARSGGRRMLGDLPLTLGEMMSERLDRVEGGRWVVQTAACIGRAFTADFVAALLEDSQPAIDGPLEALVEAEILRRGSGETLPTYEFRHALLQRVAYESMVQADRRATHGRIADLMRQRAHGEPVIPEALAHHLSRAGRAGEAIEAWLAAAAEASRRSALVEAIAHLRSGLALVELIRDDAQGRHLELRLQAALIGPLTGTRGVTSDEISECCERGLELSLSGASTPLVFPFLFGQFTFSIARGHASEAIRLSEQFLSLAIGTAQESARVVGHRLAGMAHLHQGDLLRARGHFERSLALYLPTRDASATHLFGQNTQVHSRCLLGLTRFCQGEIDEALDEVLATLRAALEQEHAHSTALALSYAGLVVGLCGAPEALMGAARRLTGVSEQHGLSPFLTVGKAFLGWALSQRGDHAQAVVVLEEAVADADAARNCLGLARYLATLAEAYRRSGRIEAAATAVARAKLMMASDSRWFEPEVWRIEALILRDRGPEQQHRAVAGLRRGAECARTLGLPVFEQRCLADLSDLLGERDTPADVEARLAALAAARHADRRAMVAVRRLAPGLCLDVP